MIHLLLLLLLIAACSTTNAHESGEPPFDGIDAVFISHNHEDHVATARPEQFEGFDLFTQPVKPPAPHIATNARFTAISRLSPNQTGPMRIQ